jgi:hypothetical protein
VIGYQFLKTGPMLDLIKKGVDANEAFQKSIGQYGRFDEAVRVIDPRTNNSRLAKGAPIYGTTV